MQITPPFGRLITAMVTPFTKSGEIDWAGVEKIANHLVSTGHDGIAVMAQLVRRQQLLMMKKIR